MLKKMYKLMRYSCHFNKFCVNMNNIKALISQEHAELNALM